MSREIDAKVAEKVMGWPIVGKTGAGYTSGERGLPIFDSGCGLFPPGLPGGWCPSKDIRQAWEVVGKVCGDQYDYIFRLHRLTGRPAPGRWWARFEHQLGKKFEGYGQDAPMAICLAALKASGE